MLGKHPLAHVRGVGRRSRGKAQLTIDEARRWLDTALTMALAPETCEGATAAICALLLGLRASEIISRTVRDLDDRGRLLRVPHGKTAAAKRTIEIPEPLRPLLLMLARRKRRDAPLFGQHTRNWPRAWVKKICVAASVPKVCAHAMRGLHATLAIRAGTSPEVVASSLGHESSTTTLQAYAAPSARDQAQQRRAVTVLTDRDKR